MTEPKLISPMLDNFVMGDPISDHDGVRCCPAIQKETDEKYIVKIISVPASEKQLEALLLSGAFSDKESALAYFSKLCDGIIEEVNVINKLSELEGYLPIEASQIEPMEDSSGYDVYLLSSYRNTLQRQLRRGTMTHLSALNLGLDLCAALAVARRMGYLYADLKPGNIYVDETQGYRIGDIGFLKLNSLKYTSLPDRYRSTYTAPEITDAFSELSTTTDVYAAGLILYQVFNDGNLPFTGDHAPSDIFPAPAYADYEMAEIILKACAPDPALRWQDPIELGQALVSYMQRNGAHDTPIVPVPEQEETAEQSDCEEEGAYMETQECATEDPASMEDAQQSTEAEAEAPEAAEPDDLEEVSEESIYAEDNEGNLTFLEDVSDETAEEQDADEIDYDEVTDEVSDMLQQADELIAHEAPAPVVQPEPIDVPVPPPIILEETAESEPVEEEEGQGEPDTAEAEADVTEDSNADVEQAEEEESDDDEHAEDIPETPRKRGGWILKAILVILAVALVAGGMYFYKTFYLQTVDAITLEVGEPGELTVNIHTQADENELSVVCTDIYGNQKTAVVSNGQAKFTDLKPNSAYAIKVNIGGFHKLIGTTTAAYTTPALTEVVQFTAVTGTTDGSVILSFTINGPDSEKWEITYTAADGTVEHLSFTGHMVTLSGLTPEQEYTFTLSPSAKLQMTGTTTIRYVAKAVVKPENLTVTACTGNKLTAQWTVREGAQATGWTVHCYNDSFDQTAVVADPVVTFTIPDDAASYTVEVTASGMSVSERVFVKENSVTAKDITVDNSDPNKIVLSWAAAGNAPTDGWILQYCVDGSLPQRLTCAESSASISPVIPGSTYDFILQTANGEPVLGGAYQYTTADAADFSGYDVTASYMEFSMCLTPAKANWDRYDLSASDYTTVFSVGKKASFLVRMRHVYDTSNDMIETLFVIRDKAGTIVNSATSSRTWTNMWYKNYCELDIPNMPQTPGEYTISIYFNGAFVNETAFTVTE